MTDDGNIGARLSALEARMAYCPFSDESNHTLWQKGVGEEEYHLTSEDIGEDCMESWNPYCEPELSQLILPSPTNIPTSCYPRIVPALPSSKSPPAATQGDHPKNCNRWHVVQSGDICDSVAETYKISSQTLYAWNPVLRQDCTNLSIGIAYCVRVFVETAQPPGPTATGTLAACKRWHVAANGAYLFLHILTYFIAKVSCFR